MFFKTPYTPNITTRRIKIDKDNEYCTKKLYVTELYLYIFLLQRLYLKKNNNSLFIKLSLFIQPHHTKRLVILRAPYRYKLGRLQVAIRYYSVVVTLINYVNNLSECYNIKKNLKIIKGPTFLSTSVNDCYRSNFTLKVCNSNFFKLKNFF
jgi:hypothetical protein